jgi:hypothetical protein
MAQSPTLEANLPKLVRAYSVVHELTEAMGLILEHTKSEGFHFSRKHSDVNPDIDLGYAPYTGATPLQPGTTWRYLGFFFDRSLTFREHVKRYTNKALTSVRAMLSLGNSVRGLCPKHKRLLYRLCVLPIATYGSRLWMYKGARMAGPLDSLRVMQRRETTSTLSNPYSTGSKEIWFLPSPRPGEIWASPLSTWTLSTGLLNPAYAQGTCSLDALSLTL